MLFLLILLCAVDFDSTLAAPSLSNLNVVRDVVTIAAPVVISASQFFEGNDGPWSTFELRVGTPAQNVRFLPGTSSSSTIVILKQGCMSGLPTDCASLRGGLFDNFTSTTWSDKGNYGLGFENSLAYTDAADFGFDTVGLGYQGSGGPTLNHSVVAGVVGTEFFLGLFGLAPYPTNFTDMNDPQSSYMTLLKQNNFIPSLSYSYTAGAPYRPRKILGSLILGGYDRSRFDTSNISLAFFSDQTRDLTVSIQSIVTNVTGKSTTLLSSAIYAFIDTSIAQLYLPVSVCQLFESTFGLVYNNASQLYLVNDTLHASLLSSNPSVTFTVGNGLSGGTTINVTLPYASFDLTADYPLVSNSSKYFPLKRATNDTQYTIGRVFLQEAYLIVDYERGKFSVSPNIWPDVAPAVNVVAIPGVNLTTTSTNSATPSNSSNTTQTSSSSGLGGGIIAGIVIGALAAIVIIAGILIFFLLLVPRRKKKTAAAIEAENNASISSPVPILLESKAIDEAGKAELHGEHTFRGQEAEGDSPMQKGAELQGPDIHHASELHGPDTQHVSELQGPDTHHASELHTIEALHAISAELADGTIPVESMSTPIYEMAGSDVPEMHGESSTRTDIEPPPAFEESKEDLLGREKKE